MSDRVQALPIRSIRTSIDSDVREPQTLTVIWWSLTKIIRILVNDNHNMVGTVPIVVSVSLVSGTLECMPAESCLVFRTVE